jgi:4,5-DOPA dioxygenase extradiol
VLASGSITHNLQRVFAQGLQSHPARPEIPECLAFRQWMLERSERRDWPALFDYRRQAPHAVDMHPTDEHLLPWFVAAGAGGTACAPRRLHSSVTHGCLGMDLYAFGPQADHLAQTLASARATSAVTSTGQQPAPAPEPKGQNRVFRAVQSP